MGAKAKVNDALTAPVTVNELVNKLFMTTEDKRTYFVNTAALQTLFPGQTLFEDFRDDHLDSHTVRKLYLSQHGKGVGNTFELDVSIISKAPVTVPACKTSGLSK